MHENCGKDIILFSNLYDNSYSIDTMHNDDDFGRFVLRVGAYKRIFSQTLARLECLIQASSVKYSQHLSRILISLLGTWMVSQMSYAIIYNNTIIIDRAFIIQIIGSYRFGYYSEIIVRSGNASQHTVIVQVLGFNVTNMIIFFSDDCDL